MVQPRSLLLPLLLLVALGKCAPLPSPVGAPSLSPALPRTSILEARMLPADVSPSVLRQLQLKGFLQQLEAQKALQMAKIKQLSSKADLTGYEQKLLQDLNQAVGPGFEAEKKKILDSLEATRLNENLKNLDATLTEHVNEWTDLHGEDLLRNTGNQQRLEELTEVIRATRAEMWAAYAKLQSLRGAGSSSNP